MGWTQLLRIARGRIQKIWKKRGQIQITQSEVSSLNSTLSFTSAVFDVYINVQTNLYVTFCMAILAVLKLTIFFLCKNSLKTYTNYYRKLKGVPGRRNNGVTATVGRQRLDSRVRVFAFCGLAYESAFLAFKNEICILKIPIWFHLTRSTWFLFTNLIKRNQPVLSKPNW